MDRKTWRLGGETEVKTQRGICLADIDGGHIITEICRRPHVRREGMTL